jgi:hypothetical protein
MAGGGTNSKAVGTETNRVTAEECTTSIPENYFGIADEDDCCTDRNRFPSSGAAIAHFRRRGRNPK